MIITGVFDREKEIEKFEYSLFFKDIKKNIEIILEEGPYFHIPIILEDPEGNIRLLSTFKTQTKRYVVGRSLISSTNCTAQGELLEGEWKLKIIKPSPIEGEFKLRISLDSNFEGYEEGIRDIFQEFSEDRVMSHREGWYTGELHNHTRFSDGETHIEHLPKEIVEKGVDFIFPTDHNIILTHYPHTEGSVVPATELTLDDQGHFNLFGLKEFLDYDRLIKKGEKREVTLKRIFQEVRKQGGYVALNHPYHPGLDLKYDIDYGDIDFLEVINSPGYAEADTTEQDLKALELMDRLWKEGHRIFAVGGSDNHDDYFGDPLNYVHMEKLCPSEILKNMKRGRTYISRVGNVDIEIVSQGKMFYPGDRTAGDINCNFKAREEVSWRVIRNGELLKEIKDFGIQFTDHLKEGEFIRVEARNDRGEPVLVINPIYC